MTKCEKCGQEVVEESLESVIRRGSILTEPEAKEVARLACNHAVGVFDRAVEMVHADKPDLIKEVRQALLGMK